MNQHQSVRYMSPWGKSSPPMSPTSMGLALTVSDFTRTNLQTLVGSKKILIFNPSVRGAIQIGIWNSTGVDQAFLVFSPTKRYATEDTPLQYKPLRAGLRLKNLNPAQTRAGAVTVLQTASSLPLQIAPGSYSLSQQTINDLIVAVESNPKSKQYTAEQLCQGTNELISFPVTFSSYSSYGATFNPGQSEGDFASTWQASIQDMSMSNTIVIFDSSVQGQAQDYVIEAMVQANLRYPQQSMLGQMQKPVGGNGKQEVVAQIHKHTEANGSNLVNMDISPM